MSLPIGPSGNSVAGRTRNTGHLVENLGLDFSNRRETARPLSAMSSSSSSSSSGSETITDRSDGTSNSSQQSLQGNILPDMVQIIEAMQSVIKESVTAACSSLLPQLVAMCAANANATNDASNQNSSGFPRLGTSRSSESSCESSRDSSGESSQESSLTNSRANMPRNARRKIPSSLVDFPRFKHDGDILVFIDDVERAAKLLQLDDDSLVDMVLHKLDHRTYN